MRCELVQGVLAHGGIVYLVFLFFSPFLRDGEGVDCNCFCYHWHLFVSTIFVIDKRGMMLTGF